MIMLGALVALTNITTEDAVHRSLKETVPRGTEESNLKAFQLGLKLANEASGQAVA
jgi:2-oxoglutarate ferredoxin oxidoreductase subunit gamma